MKALLSLVICFIALSLSSASAADLFSSAYWEIEGPKGKTTWVEIHNLDEAKAEKEKGAAPVFHIAILSRKSGRPAWDLQWEVEHLAITEAALERSVLRPYKTKGAYPERFLHAYAAWKEAAKNGQTVLCTTSLKECRK